MDREKVIKGLQHCLHYDGSCLDCPYDSPNCQNDVLTDAIALLKEQEPQPVTFDRQCEEEPGHWVRKGFCPKCHQLVIWIVNREYCGFCGQKVKWE